MNDNKKDILEGQLIGSEADDKTARDDAHKEATAETAAPEADSKDKSDAGNEGAALKKAIANQAREDERPHSTSFTLAKILGGDILSSEMLRNNIGLIFLVVAFVIVYISNRYSVQKDLIEIDKLNKEVVDAKYRALSSNSLLTEKTRESKVLEMLKTSKDSILKIASQPPYIINVPEK